jgi:hypothetical protein
MITVEMSVVEVEVLVEDVELPIFPLIVMPLITPAWVLDDVTVELEVFETLLVVTVVPLAVT